VDREQIAFEVAGLKANVQQWEWDRRQADRDRYYASVSIKAGAGLLVVGVLVALLSYTFMGAYLAVIGIGIAMISVIRASGARDHLVNLADQLAYGKRRLAELTALLE
jgi:hypothetical protein